jgi:uncharacterized membrane protein YcaP (DUF421 family)
MAIEWDKLFGFTVAPLELVLRGSVMFLFLRLLFRVVTRRRVGAMGMAGTYTSISDAVVVVGTIVLWNHFFCWLGFRSAWMQRLLGLEAKLREKAYVEPDGQISVVKRPAIATSRR